MSRVKDFLKPSERKYLHTAVGSLAIAVAWLAKTCLIP